MTILKEAQRAVFPVLCLGFCVLTIHVAAVPAEVNGCTSPKSRPIGSFGEGSNSSTCPWWCCCNDTIRLVNCSSLNKVLPTVFPVRVRTLILDQNSMNTFDRDNCSIFRQSKSLERLFATGNRIDTINKNCFRGLHNLTVLNLSRNALTSFPMTDTQYPFKVLDLSNNNIKQLDKSLFIFMPNLTSLYLDNNSISRLPSFKSTEEKNLKVLSLRNNGLRTIDESGLFSKRSDIKELYLSDNELTDLPFGWLVGAFGLKILDLRNSSSQSDMEGKVEWLYPGYNDELETIDLSLNGFRSLLHNAFDSNTGLRTIDLSYNALEKLPDGLLVRQDNLTTFKAQENSLVNISGGIWGRKARLEYVNLANNSIERIENEAISSLVGLRYLDLSGNSLVSLSFLETPDLTSLETLLLYNNSIRTSPNVSLLIKLRVLELQDNQLNEVPNVSNLSKLEEIDLSRNNISILNTYAFSGATRLTRINLESNNIVSIMADSLFILPKSLLWLNLLGNPLRCDCHMALTSMKVRDSYQWGIDLGNITCLSPLAYQGMRVTSVPHSPCIGKVKSVKSIILSALLAGIVIAVIILAFLYSRYRRVGRGNARRRRSYPVEEKAAQMNSYEEEVGRLMSPVKTAGNYQNLRGSKDLVGGGASVTGSNSRLNGNAIKPFEEEFYV